MHPVLSLSAPDTIFLVLLWYLLIPSRNTSWVPDSLIFAFLIYHNLEFGSYTRLQIYQFDSICFYFYKKHGTPSNMLTLHPFSTFYIYGFSLIHHLPSLLCLLRMEPRLLHLLRQSYYSETIKYILFPIIHWFKRGWKVFVKIIKTVNVLWICNFIFSNLY